MIISKKKLEELVLQRIAEKEQQDYFFRRIGEVERELHQRIAGAVEGIELSVPEHSGGMGGTENLHTVIQFERYLFGLQILSELFTLFPDCR